MSLDVLDVFSPIFFDLKLKQLKDQAAKKTKLHFALSFYGFSPPFGPNKGAAVAHPVATAAAILPSPLKNIMMQPQQIEVKVTVWSFPGDQLRHRMNLSGSTYATLVSTGNST